MPSFYLEEPSNPCHLIRKNSIPPAYYGIQNSGSKAKEISLKMKFFFFMGLAMHGSNEKCLNFIENLVKKDVSLNSIFLDLIPQTTRRLSSLWEDDFCSYSELMLALWRLQNVFSFESSTYSLNQH